MIKLCNPKYEAFIYHPDKKWITFVHGFTHNSKYFEEQAEALSGNFNTLLINLLGHGSRPKCNTQLNLYNYAFDILNIFNELKIDKTIYWGTHTGAAVGLLLTCEAPNFIELLVSEGTPVPGINIPSISKYFSNTRKVFQEKGLEEALDYWFYNSGWFKYMHENLGKEIIENQYAMLKKFKGDHFDYPTPSIEYNLLPKIKKIKIPCLLYNGEFDLEDFKNAAETISNKNPNITQVTIKDTGGFPSWENPTNVLNEVVNFLKHKLPGEQYANS